MANRFAGCPVKNESPERCPRCGATVSGNDEVNGICQAPKLNAVVITDEMVERALKETNGGSLSVMRRALEAALSGENG